MHEFVAPMIDTAAPAGMAGVADLIRRIAPSRISVLLLGETGVGKERMAELVHASSRRRDRPLLRLNCGALTESLLESELFGHEKGAFTGATTSKPGLLEASDSGTVLLDEVGELSPQIQVKLLRVLEDRMVMRIGALAPRPVDVRFVSATHRDLAVDVARGRFRADLLFRLDGVTVRIPPLRERRDEIAGLVRELARAHAERERTPEPRFSPAALAALEAYDWPGNVRELRNVVERAVLLCDGGVVQPAQLRIERRPAAAAPAPRPAPDAPDAPATGGERARIERALAETAGNQTRAAARLGISRATLVRRLRVYRLPRPRLRGHCAGV